MLKKHLFGIMIISFVLIGISSIQTSMVDSNGLLPLETWITSMTWDVYESLLESEISQFAFYFAFDIYNPNDENITLQFSTSEQFVSDFMALLEDNNHNVSSQIGISLPVFTERTLEPGITQDSTGLLLRFDTDNLTVLPNGDYIFWIYACDNPSVSSHLTYLTMIGGLPFIDYYITPTPTPTPSPTPPTTPPSTEPTSSIKKELLITSISATAIYLYILKKRKKDKKIVDLFCFSQ